METAILELKSEITRSDNVVDISGVMKIIQIFRESAFEQLSPAAQSEVLRERVRKIVVRENGFFVEIYGKNTGSNRESSESERQGGFVPEGSRSNMSNVLTVSKLVRPERFELPTPWFEARYSIQLSYGRNS